MRNKLATLIFAVLLFFCCNLLAMEDQKNDGFFIFAEAGYVYYSGAADTFNILFETESAIRFGGGLGYDLGTSFFLTAEATYSRLTGERVWASSTGSFIRTGFYHNISIIPITGTIGFRVLQTTSFDTYMGLGAGYYIMSIDDEIKDYESQSNIGFHGLIGARFFIDKNFFIIIEGRWETAKDLIGESGVSLLFEDNDIGGFSGTIKIGYRF